MPFWAGKPTIPIAGLLPEEIPRVEAEMARGARDWAPHAFLRTLEEAIRAGVAAAALPTEVGDQLHQWLAEPEVRRRAEEAVAADEQEQRDFTAWLKEQLTRRGVPAEAAEGIMLTQDRAADAYIQTQAAHGWPDVWQARARRHPGDPLWPYLAAHSYYRAGQLGLAVWSLTEAAKLAPDDPRSLYLLGVIFYGVYAELSGVAAAADTTRRVEPEVDAAFWQHIGIAPPGPGEVPAWQRDAATRRAALASLKRPPSAGQARDRALQCFAAVLGCDLGPEDTRTVERHVSLILGSGS